MIEALDQMQHEAMAELVTTTTLDDLRAWRARYLGKQSPLSEISKGMAKLDATQRPVMGQRINAVKQALEHAWAECETELETAAQGAELERERVDITMPGRPVAAGRLHPITQILRETEEIFAHMGFAVWESREVETDEYNFALLNMPPDHPARDMWDTFYVQTAAAGGNLVLRTHTSPGQIHSMRHFAPDPIRVILPGKCYRYEAVDATHDMQFYQVEGVAVSDNITLADLKGTLEQFARQLLGHAATIRFRPSFFPFTEPSVEVDVRCIFCDGSGCRTCKRTGWIEVLGGGMIHPTVLRNGGYDPERHSGFAFGMGPGRLAQLKYGIDDGRVFFSGDLRLMEQF
ncbi:MAG: phenylalanine--tRNA ligase subunit alpha [Herpetosiphon sp.]